MLRAKRQKVKLTMPICYRWIRYIVQRFAWQWRRLHLSLRVGCTSAGCGSHKSTHDASKKIVCFWLKYATVELYRNISWFRRWPHDHNVLMSCGCLHTGSVMSWSCDYYTYDDLIPDRFFCIKLWNYDKQMRFCETHDNKNLAIISLVSASLKYYNHHDRQSVEQPSSA